MADELEELYRSRYLTFRNGMAAITGSYDSARDVVQEAFARALRDRGQYRGDGPLVGWVWRIAVRVALESRRNGHELTLEELVAEAPAPPSPERDPVLAAALRELPPRRRLIVFLRYFADLSYTEIAALCEVSEGTVAATLAHAHTDLSKALQTRRQKPGPGLFPRLHGEATVGLAMPVLAYRDFCAGFSPARSGSSRLGAPQATNRQPRPGWRSEPVALSQSLLGPVPVCPVRSRSGHSYDRGVTFYFVQVLSIASTVERPDEGQRRRPC